MVTDLVDLRRRLEQLQGSMRKDRNSFEGHWQELADYLQPRRTRFFVQDRNKGDKRSQKIIDSTGRYSARTLSSGLHAGLTSPARPWFKLTTPDPDLAEFAPVKQWLHIVTQRMATVFLQSNLYNALPNVYLDMGCFGTAAMSTLPDKKDLFRARVYPVGSFHVGLDHRGVVTTFAREYELTVRQVVELYGQKRQTGTPEWSNISHRVRQLYERGDYEQPVELCWLVLPNPMFNPNAWSSAYSLPYLSAYWEVGDQDRRFLELSGFKSCPVLSPRWHVTDEDAYGTDCPGMAVLGDVKQLQLMHRRKAQGVEKGINPPTQAPSALRTQKTSLLPGDITYVDVREGMQGMRAIHEVTLNLEHLQRDIEATQYRIQRGFYEDLFLMLAMSDPYRGNQPITAREVEERHEEKLLALGPVLERTNDELLDPLIDRTYQMMDENGLLPEPPEDIIGIALKVEYLSIMAQAQKLVGVVGQDRFLQSVVGLSQVWPEVRHKVKAFQLVEDYADMLGVDPRALRTDDEAETLLGEEARQAQAAMQAQQAKDLASAAATAGAQPIAPDSPLDRVLGQGAPA